MCSLFAPIIIICCHLSIAVFLATMLLWVLFSTLMSTFSMMSHKSFESAKISIKSAV